MVFIHRFARTDDKRLWVFYKVSEALASVNLDVYDFRGNFGYAVYHSYFSTNIFLILDVSDFNKMEQRGKESWRI